MILIEILSIASMLIVHIIVIIIVLLVVPGAITTVTILIIVNALLVTIAIGYAMPSMMRHEDRIQLEYSMRRTFPGLNRLRRKTNT